MVYFTVYKRNFVDATKIIKIGYGNLKNKYKFIFIPMKYILISTN